VLVIGFWATRREYAPPLSLPLTRSAAPDTFGGSDRAKVEKEPLAQPATPAKPGDVASLREPGSVREFSEEESLQKRRAIEAGDLAAPTAGSGSATAGGFAEVGGVRQDVAGERKGAARTQANLPETAPRSVPVGRPGQVLLFLYTTYRVSVHQDGTVVLSAEGYTCAVRQEGSLVDPDLASLFVQAASAGEAAGAPAPARQGAAVVRLLQPQSVGEEATGEVPGADLPGAAGTAIESRIRTLLRNRYLPLMESRCGAVPRIVGGS